MRVELANLILFVNLMGKKVLKLYPDINNATFSKYCIYYLSYSSN